MAMVAWKLTIHVPILFDVYIIVCTHFGSPINNDRLCHCLELELLHNDHSWWMLIYTAANLGAKNAGDPVPNTTLCGSILIYQPKNLVTKLVNKKTIFIQYIDDNVNNPAKSRKICAIPEIIFVWRIRTSSFVVNVQPCNLVLLPQ